MAVTVRPDQFTTLTTLEAPRFDVRSDLRTLDLAFQQLQPPPALWVTPDDIIEVGIRNSRASVTIRATVRILLADGGISLIQQDISPISDRSLNYFSVALGYGYLLSAAAYAVGSTTPKRGQTYVSLQLVRPPTSSFVIDQPMGADYIAGSNFVGWPYGRIVGATEGNGFIREVIGTVPAAGADWLQTVPTGARWRIHGVTAELVTSAVVQGRQVQLRIDDGVNIATFETVGVTQTASQTLFYNFIPGYPSTGVTIGSMVGVALPQLADLDQGWRVSSFTSTLDAGDQWSNIRFWVEEWLED